MPSACIRTRLKFLAHVDMGQSPPSAEYSDSAGEGLPFLQGTADFGHVFPEPKTFCSSPNKVAISGDILFSVRAPVGELNIAKQDIGIGRGLCAIRAESSLNDRFAWWALHEAREQLNYVSTGSTYEAVSVEDVANTLLCDVPIDKQRRIADYLDLETVRMDTLLAAKERLLEILAEKRRALITHVVTRGLSPNAPLRDTGIPWLGKIPNQWKTMKLKHVAYLQSGETITADSITETGEYPVFGGNGIRGYKDSYTHDGNYVLIGRQGALCGNIKYASGRFWASEHAVVVTIKENHSVIWLGELLDIMNLNQYSQSAAQPGLAVDLISNLIIPVPPINEQREIVAHIRKETSKIDAMRKATERTIVLLKERRAALITEAVTGRIDISLARHSGGSRNPEVSVRGKNTGPQPSPG